jgi:hypothetical protein
VYVLCKRDVGNDGFREGVKTLKKVKCVSDMYGNFTYNKVYEAVPFATKGLGEYKQLADFRIEDDDGDLYTVAETIDTLKRDWEWVE